MYDLEIENNTTWVRLGTHIMLQGNNSRSIWLNNVNELMTFSKIAVVWNTQLDQIRNEKHNFHNNKHRMFWRVGINSTRLNKTWEQASHLYTV